VNLLQTTLIRKWKSYESLRTQHYSHSAQNLVTDDMYEKYATFVVIIVQTNGGLKKKKQRLRYTPHLPERVETARH